MATMKKRKSVRTLDRKKELENCTFVKTMLMLLVVLDHSMAFWTGSWFTKDPIYLARGLSILSNALNSVHIYGFTLVSGYIFYHIKFEQGRYQKFLPFVRGKAKRLLIPYLCTAVLWVIPIWSLFFEDDVWTIVKNYVFAISPSQLWFLWMLFDVFIIFWLLSDFFAKHDWLGLAVVLGMYGCGLVGGSVAPNVFQIWTAFRYMPLFWLGFKLRQHGSAMIRRIPALIWIGISIVLFVLVQYLSGFESVTFKLLKIGFTFVMNVAGALMAFVVLQKIADKVNWDNKFFRFVSERSMTVYLLHQQVICFFIYWLNGLLNPYLHAVVNFVAAMVFSLLIATVLMKFRVTRFLIGEK